ncbi:hypothetical protein O181_002467 [Austropuccinia psidii MF-1]|uniref:Uncharacterized protein n=1 Tax=Austropuccinia psidii MF-1 TaxID=1389203 RepID=A0A9Q3BCV0_9BASI|nr:hypothetical protein [Austropuccinia psidii MF-1]
MNSRQIGDHCTSIVGLEKFALITLVTWEERNIHFVVARRAVHTVLGRHFLADNNIILDFSQQKVEKFSYKEPDGRRLCLPICSPQKVEQRENPQEGIKACSFEKEEGYNSSNVEDREFLENIGNNCKYSKNKESPQDIETFTKKSVRNKT